MSERHSNEENTTGVRDTAAAVQLSSKKQNKKTKTKKQKKPKKQNNGDFEKFGSSWRITKMASIASLHN